MTQEQLEMVEAIDQEIHILGKHRLIDLKEKTVVEHLHYMKALTDKLFLLMLRERRENDDAN